MSGTSECVCKGGIIAKPNAPATYPSHLQIPHGFSLYPITCSDPRHMPITQLFHSRRFRLVTPAHRKRIERICSSRQTGLLVEDNDAEAPRQTGPMMSHKRDVCHYDASLEPINFVNVRTCNPNTASLGHPSRSSCLLHWGYA